jgi:hypothetical protein
VLEMPGELDQGYRSARVLDVAQVEPVAEVRRDEQGGQVQGLAAGCRVDERGRGEDLVALTDHGWELYRQAENRYSETERDFTATLGDAGAAGLRQALRTVLSDNGHA